VEQAEVGISVFQVSKGVLAASFLEISALGRKTDHMKAIFHIWLCCFLSFKKKSIFVREYRYIKLGASL
jgi:hypothetical protein